MQYTIKEQILFFLIKVLAYMTYFIGGILVIALMSLGAIIAIIIGIFAYVFKLPQIIRFIEYTINKDKITTY